VPNSRTGSARVVSAHKDRPTSADNNKVWQQAIGEDFAEFRKAGIQHRR